MRNIVFVLAIGVLTAAGLAGCTSKDKKTPGNVSITQGSDAVSRITAPDLKSAMDSGLVIVIDVRGQAAYDAGHIKGSIVIPGTEIANRIDELPRDKEIITYCS